MEESTVVTSVTRGRGKGGMSRVKVSRLVASQANPAFRSSCQPYLALVPAWGSQSRLLIREEAPSFSPVTTG
jgi:hypothetical protein